VVVTASNSVGSSSASSNTTAAATTTEPPSSSPTPVSGVTVGQIAFDDEFDGSSLDTSKWGTCLPYGPMDSCTQMGDPGDFLDECYTPRNVTVADGLLSLTAKQETVQCNGRTNSYSSGLIESHGHFDFTYGYVEARIKVPAGSTDSVAFWPAFWLSPSDFSWPPEMNIFEFFGGSSTGSTGAMAYGQDGFLHPQRFTTTYHRPDRTTSSADFYGPGGAGSTLWDQDYHVWGMNWRPGRFDVYVDSNPTPIFTETTGVSTAPIVRVRVVASARGSDRASGRPRADLALRSS
jgi:beta-glucanase (GH16 family)